MWNVFVIETNLFFFFEKLGWQWLGHILGVKIAENSRFKIFLISLEGLTTRFDFEIAIVQMENEIENKVLQDVFEIVYWMKKTMQKIYTFIYIGF